jgi:hypothetical protein
MRAVTQSEGQFRFIYALARLMDCDNSPLQRFKREFFSDWRAAFANPESCYIGLDKRAEMERSGRTVLERWTAACNLLTPSGSPPLWLIGHVDFLLQRAVDAIIEAPEPLVSGLSAKTQVSSITTESGDERVIPPLPPMLASRRGETWREFKRRILPLLKSQWEAEQKTYKKQKIVKPVAQQETNFDHSEWFILYQCCGWSLREIASCPRYDSRGGPHGAQQTIWQGIQSVAKQTGLQVSRRAGLKKSSR